MNSFQYERLMGLLEDDERAPREFGPSKMSRSLARAMFEKREFFQGKACLDVGTGTGYHAVLAGALGASRVDAIDIDEAYLACARARFAKFAPKFAPATASDFKQSNVEEVGSKFPPELKWDVILCNPPSFFADTEDERCSHRGVYGDLDPAAGEEGSVLYRLLHRETGLVAKRLVQESKQSAGGIVLCTWPQIERRVCMRAGVVETPDATLEGWSWKHAGVRPELKTFYRYSFTVGADGYGISEFKNKIRRHSALYCTPPDNPEFPMAFRYGVLCAERTTPSALRVHP